MIFVAICCGASFAANTAYLRPSTVVELPPLDHPWSACLLSNHSPFVFLKIFFFFFFSSESPTNLFTCDGQLMDSGALNNAYTSKVQLAGFQSNLPAGSRVVGLHFRMRALGQDSDGFKFSITYLSVNVGGIEVLLQTPVLLDSTALKTFDWNFADGRGLNLAVWNQLPASAFNDVKVTIQGQSWSACCTRFGRVDCVELAWFYDPPTTTTTTTAMPTTTATIYIPPRQTTTSYSATTTATAMTTTTAAAAETTAPTADPLSSSQSAQLNGVPRDNSPNNGPNWALIGGISAGAVFCCLAIVCVVLGLRRRKEEPEALAVVTPEAPVSETQTMVFRTGVYGPAPEAVQYSARGLRQAPQEAPMPQDNQIHVNNPHYFVGGANAQFGAPTDHYETFASARRSDPSQYEAGEFQIDRHIQH